MPATISITSVSSFSPLGNTMPSIWAQYLSGKSLLRKIPAVGGGVMAGALGEKFWQAAQDIKAANPNYQDLDNSVLFAIMASRRAVMQAGWEPGDTFGVNIGSGRGATDIFERHHGHFLETGEATPQAFYGNSPGNLSSWVAHDLKTTGPEISHSISCSSALHALLNGVAWLRAGMASKFLVGGSEAPLTPFTIAQLQAMRVYSRLEDDFACRALDTQKRANTLVLGEGAAVACLEVGYKPKALGYVEGIGYASEAVNHNVSVSAEADCLQKSMRMALAETRLADIDAVVMHAPGTVRGDMGELNAIKTIFGEKLPLLTSNKWKIGHTLGASGMLSMELAILMLQNDTFIASPFYPQKQNRPLHRILVNSVGFGGNAVSILIAK